MNSRDNSRLGGPILKCHVALCGLRGGLEGANRGCGGGGCSGRR